MFKLYCDRCGKEVREVTGPDAKTISLDGPFICNPCKSYEAKLVDKVEKLKRIWDRRVNEMINASKKELLENLREE